MMLKTACKMPILWKIISTLRETQCNECTQQLTLELRRLSVKLYLFYFLKTFIQKQLGPK